MRRLPRADLPERLDAPTHDPAVLGRSLAQIATVNRWLGGRRALRLALAPYLAGQGRVLDIGTGSADLPLMLAHAGPQEGASPTVVATDRHPQILGEAARRTTTSPGIRLAAADALALPFASRSFDVVLFSLVLHHLSDERAVQALREAARVAPLIIVNELHRTHRNYAGALLLSRTLWRGNPLTSHDGPLSVLRAYRPDELRRLAEAAGLTVLELRRRWFQRLVLVAAGERAT